MRREQKYMSQMCNISGGSLTERGRDLGGFEKSKETRGQRIVKILDEPV